MYSPETAASIITACAVLHNVMVLTKYPLPTEEEILNEMDEPENDIQIENNNAGNVARRNLILEYFTACKDPFISQQKIFFFNFSSITGNLVRFASTLKKSY